MSPGTGQVTMAMAPRPAGDVLAWGRGVLDPALRAAVATLPEAVRRVAEFHFGWCDASGDPADGERVTTIAPTLALLTADAAGGAHDAALPAAVAIELVQGFTGMHDAVIDGDALPGDAPSACAVFGIGPVILVGSALQTLAFDTIAAASGARARDGLRMLSATVHELVEGRMTELALETQADVSVEECMQATSARTGALLGCACALGELLATGDERRIGLMRTFGERLGLVAALVDDIRDIWRDPGAAGKADGFDVAAGRTSLPVVAAMNSGAAQAGRLRLLRGSGDAPSGQDVGSVSALVEAADGRSWAEAEASHQLAAAIDALSRTHAANPSRASDELATLATLVRTRER